MDQLEQNLEFQQSQPTHGQRQHAPRAPPGLPSSGEQDEPVCTWPAGLGKGPGGSLQWGVP
eukprot:9334985-Prorocentrum_lima.AAC.1